MAQQLLQDAIDNYEEVEPILQKIDFEPARQLWEKWAEKEHFKLLKKNKDLFKRVPTIKELTDEKMQGQSLLYAMAIAKILKEAKQLKEGKSIGYVNLKFSMKEGKVVVEKKEES